MKRIVIATLFGLVVGGFCATVAFRSDILEFTVANLIWVLLNRAVMGFAIGISGLKLHWAWNGIVMGLVVGSIFAYSLYLDLGLGPLPLANAAMNGLYGLTIEFFTTVVFKAPAAQRIGKPALA